jgi:hypothetical protein
MRPAENRESMDHIEKTSQMKNQWRRWIEPWYLAYALSGATTSGMLLILLPLAVSRTGGASHIGLVMAAFSLGGLTAPLWGSLADRYRLHRWMLFGGFLMTTIGLAAFPFTSNKSTYVGLAMLQSMGAAAAGTVANLFVVEGHPREEWDERQVKPDALEEHFGPIDLIFEATGAARLEFDLLSVLGINGLYVLTGIPGGDRPINVEGATLMRQLVLKNQVMVGSVNASRRHFQKAVEDLEKARKTWGNAIDRIITHRFPYTQYAEALSLRSPDEIKTVLEWENPL